MDDLIITLKILLNVRNLSVRYMGKTYGKEPAPSISFNFSDSGCTLFIDSDKTPTNRELLLAKLILKNHLEHAHRIQQLEKFYHSAVETVREFSSEVLQSNDVISPKLGIASLKAILSDYRFVFLIDDEIIYDSGIEGDELAINVKKLDKIEEFFLDVGDGCMYGYKRGTVKLLIASDKEKLPPLYLDLARTNIFWASQQDELIKKEQRITEEAEKLRVTLLSIGDGVIVTDREGKIVLMNSIACDLTGWSEEDAAGKNTPVVFNIINEKTGQPCKNPAEKILSHGNIIILENHTALVARDGTQRSIGDSGAPIRDRKGDIVGAVLVFRDITKEKKLNEELLKIKKLESVGFLAGGIAHDFNNILTAILGNIELAKMSLNPAGEAYPLLLEAEKASVRAKDLTQQLLIFSKGGDPIRKTSSLAAVISDSTNFILRGSKVACRFEIPEDLWLVDIDTGQVSQVVQNIILNARQAMPEGGEIIINCANISDITQEVGLKLPGKKYIRIIIQDNGSGIPVEYLDKIFDPYFSTRQSGSGLGLAVTHSIISKHYGHISVQPTSGGGTTFTIYLPASDQQVAVGLIKEARKSEKVARARILVMDDEQLILKLLTEMIAALGHEVLQAKDGKEAIAIFNRQRQCGKPIDMIIMDLTIPGGMGGKDAVKEILKVSHEAKVVVASGYSNDPIMANYRQYGFKAAIAKPFKMAELNDMLQTVLH